MQNWRNYWDIRSQSGSSMDGHRSGEPISSTHALELALDVKLQVGPPTGTGYTTECRPCELAA